MRGNEGVYRVKTVAARGVLQIGGLRVLMAFAKARPHFQRPGVVIPDRYFHQPGVQCLRAVLYRLFQLLHQLQQLRGRQDVRVKAQLERCIGRAYFDNPRPLLLAQQPGDGHAGEAGGQRHGFADLGKQELVAAKTVANAHAVLPVSRASGFATVSAVLPGQCASQCSRKRV